MAYPMALIHPRPARGPTREETPLAKPNYAFAKRQRDLAKKQKKEEKMQERKLRKAVGTSDDPDTPEQESEGAAPPDADAAENTRPARDDSAS